MSRKRIINNINLKVSINNIDTVSGIFAGTNYANNWSSHRKNNYGLGSVSNSAVHHNYSYVIDNDIVDTPIENQSYSFVDRSNDFIANEVVVEEININVMDTSAAVSIGDNLLNSWSSHSKRTGGLGRMVGTCINSQNSTSVIDNDLVDTPIVNVDSST